MRVVVDAVVFVRALINHDGSCGRLLARAGEYDIVLSLEVTHEILGVLQRPELRERLYSAAGLPQLQAVLAILGEAEAVVPGAVVSVCRDSKDDKFFACAIAGGADYIVSEDEDILAVREYNDVRTIRAAEFLRLLDAPPNV